MSGEVGKLVSEENQQSGVVSSSLNNSEVSLGSDSKSPTTSESKSAKSTQSDDKETKSTGTKVPAASRIGRLCLAHHAPKAGPPPPEQKNGVDITDDTMSRLSEEYLRSPLSDVMEENELDLFRGKYSRSSLSPDHILGRPPKSDRKIPNGSMGGDLYMEATGRRRSSDQGVVLTTDTDSFIIGQKVWVGGIRPGQIAYIGETHFAPGDWAGVVLDEPNGKNDGCVSGKRYFQCEPKKGIFSRLTRLTHYPLPNAIFGKESSPTQTARSILSPERSRATSPTSSIKSSMRRSPGKQGMTVGDRVIVSSGFGSRPGILKYMGETKFAQGTWCGVQLDEPTGKNDGAVDGIRYFDCPSKYGVFVPIAKVTLSPSSRKSRLSRAGSRESLTSVGTLNSVATTNTSRLRMSTQRIPTATKVPSVPKNTYSLQDVIREKQNHIEQLMIERDLDREDSQNQAMLFQKNISELKSRVIELEKLLEDERKKSEELQFSIDEAQFCGDELNAQTQVYKEKIIELEQQITSAGINSVSVTEPSSSKYTAEYETLQKNYEKSLQENESLRSLLETRLKEYEINAKDLTERETQIQEEAEFLRRENEEMRKELLEKDENTEKLYLTIKESQNSLLEETTSLKKSSEEEEKKCTELLRKCSEKEELCNRLQSDIEALKGQLDAAAQQKDETISKLKRLTDENLTLKENLEAATKNISNLKEYCEKSSSGNEEVQKLIVQLQSENESLKQVQAQISQTNQTYLATIEDKTKELVDLNARLESVQKNKEDLLKEIEVTKKQYSETGNTITTLEAEIIQKDQEAETNKILIEELEKKVKALEEKLKANEAETSKLTESTETQNGVLEKYRLDLESFQNQYDEVSKNLAERESCLNDLSNEHDAKCKIIEDLINEKEKLFSEAQVERESLNNHISELTEKLNNFDQTQVNLKAVDEKLKESETQKDNLTKELHKLQAELKALENENTSKTSSIELKDKKIEELTLVINEYETKCKQLAQSLENLTTQHENIKAANNSYEKKIAEQEIENSDKSRQIESLNQKYEEVSKQYQTLQQELTNLRNTSSDTNSEIVRLTQSLVEQQNAYEELLGNSSTIKNKLEKELDESNQNISTLKKEIDSLNEESKVKDLHSSELQAQIEKYKSENQRKGNEIDSLNQMIKSEKEKLNKLIATNSSEAESLKSQLDSQISSLQSEISALQAELENGKTNSKSTEETLLKQISDFGNEKEKLLDELKNLKDSEVSLKTSLEQQRENENTSIQTFNLQLNKKEEAIKNLNDTITSLTEASTCLTTKLTNVETTCEQLKQENESINQKLAAEAVKNKELKENVDKLTVSIQEKDSEREQLAKINVDLKSQLDVNEKENSAAVESMKLSQDEKQKLIDSLKHEITEKTENISALQIDIDKEKENSRALKYTVEKMSVIIEDVKNQLQQKDETIKAQTDSIIQLNELVAKLQTDVNSNKHQMAEMAATYTNQIEMLNQSLSQKTEENEKLHKETVELKSQISSNGEKLSTNLKKEIDAKTELSEKYQKLSTEHDACKGIIIELQNQLVNNNKAIDDLTTKVKGLESIVEHDSNKAIIMEKEHEKLRKKFEKLQEDKSATEKILQAEIDNLKSDTKLPSMQPNNKYVELDNSIEQINFLNSIIADMQKKNEALKARIDTLETISLDFTKPEAFNLVGKRNPAPRLFCDICEIFDGHDTEDCPQQCSESPPASSLPRLADNKNGDDGAATKKLPPPRMFCDICDVFDAHETEDCPMQCF